MNFSASSIQDHHIVVDNVQQVATLSAWIGGTIPVNNHHDCLRVLGLNNGIEIVNTISGASCFFDAVRQCALQFGFMRFIEEVVVVVVVVVYLTTNQRHMGYLSSGNGHLAGRYSTP